jgi:hypothetical protein
MWAKPSSTILGPYSDSCRTEWRLYKHGLSLRALGLFSRDDIQAISLHSHMPKQPRARLAGFALSLKGLGSRDRILIRAMRLILR